MPEMTGYFRPCSLVKTSPSVSGQNGSWRTVQNPLFARRRHIFRISASLSSSNLPSATHGLSISLPEAIEKHLRRRLESGRKVHTTFGVQYRDTIKPMTVHQEFRVLTRILNVAVKLKRLASNPCTAVEFPVPANKINRKPHY